jgi:2-polyprenyl-3-methyl-5-hydroxy-6-metoxy-1,4-benzoquinol methylase
MTQTMLYRLKRLFGGLRAEDIQGAPPPDCTTAVRAELDYLHLEVSRLRSLVRHLSAGTINSLPLWSGTRDSFDFQWADTKDGDWTRNRPELKQREPNLVLQFTRLPREWFSGKSALDAGCGSGRFSWALASLGAQVLAIDQSQSGVEHTLSACAEFDGRVRAFRHDLTNPIPTQETFDLAFSFGVLHHTGDTYTAFKNVASLVKPGGYLFVMIYGEPSPNDMGSLQYYSEVERLRRATAGMSFSERYDYIRAIKGADVGGWFDAVSPAISDTHPLHELREWFAKEGFVDFTRTIEHPNHHIVARKGSRHP